MSSEEEEIGRRIRAKVSEIALRHGRKNTPEYQEEVRIALKEILVDFPALTDLPKWAVDPVFEADEAKQTVTGKVWIGGLPPPTLVPSMDDPDYEDDPEGV